MIPEIKKEEIETLNFILDRIPRAEKFNINDLYSVKLREVYDTQKILFTEYQNKINELKSLGYFKRITDFLIENKFAKWYDESKVWLILLSKGIFLTAYDTFQSYLDAKRGSSEEEIQNRITELISSIAPYGEFVITLPTEYPELTTSDPGVHLELSEKGKLLYQHRHHVLAEEALIYLVNNGFAINRHDIDRDGLLYRQLTDKGRELKKIGSYQQYIKYENEEEQKGIKRQELSDRLLESNLATAKIQKSLRSINLWIAGATVVAALYYIQQMVVSAFQSHLYVPVSLIVLLLLSGAIIGIAIYKLISHLLKRKE